jgi:hypothetical protein
MTTQEDIEDLEKKVADLERRVRQLTVDVERRATVNGVLQLDARVTEIEKKLGQKS